MSQILVCIVWIKAVPYVPKPFVRAAQIKPAATLQGGETGFPNRFAFSLHHQPCHLRAFLERADEGTNNESADDKSADNESADNESADNENEKRRRQKRRRRKRRQRKRRQRKRRRQKRRRLTRRRLTRRLTT